MGIVLDLGEVNEVEGYFFLLMDLVFAYKLETTRRAILSKIAHV